MLDKEKCKTCEFHLNCDLEEQKHGYLTLTEKEKEKFAPKGKCISYKRKKKTKEVERQE